MKQRWMHRNVKRSTDQWKRWWKQRPYYARRWVDRKRLKNRDFTIISNNCWGGHAYRYFDRSYTSPTVGMYFGASDYLKFIYNLRYYMSLDLAFIPWSESRHKEAIQRSKKGNVPVGVLDDIQVVFLHYKSEAEALDKWNRRRERMNFDNVIIKFSINNMDADEAYLMKQFDELPFHNKFMITTRTENTYPWEIYWEGPVAPNGDVQDATYFPGNLKIRKLLDLPPESYPEEGFAKRG